MSRWFQFGLRSKTIGRRLVWSGVAVMGAGLAISVAVELWAESLNVNQWMNVWFTVGIVSIFSRWGGVGIGAALIVAGIWCIRRQS